MTPGGSRRWTSAAVVAVGVIGAACTFVAAAACSDVGATLFRCEEGVECPLGQRCADNRCVACPGPLCPKHISGGVDPWCGRAAACDGKECGEVWDDCGATFDCGSCELPFECGAGWTANLCGCEPLTCSPAGLECGPVQDDGCGGSLLCPPCEVPRQCGAGGLPNRCAVPAPATAWALSPSVATADRLLVASGPVDTTYLAGTFAGALTLPDDAQVAVGPTDLFVARLRPVDGVPEWVRRYGHADYPSSLDSLAVDGEGNAYVTGQTVQEETFGLVAGRRTGEGYRFLLALDPQGTPRWVRRFKKEGRVVLDPAGAAYVGGGLDDAWFPANHVAAEGETIFHSVVWLDESGASVLAIERAWPWLSEMTFVADTDRNVYLGASIRIPQRVGDEVPEGAGDTVAYVEKIGANGQSRWRHTFETAQDDEIAALAIDDERRLYVAGRFGRADGDRDAATVFALDSEGEVVWRREVARDYADPRLERAVALPGGGLRLGGWGWSTGGSGIDLGGGPLYYDEDRKAFVVAWDATGAHEWSTLIRVPGDHYVSSIAISTGNATVVTGTYSGGSAQGPWELPPAADGATRTFLVRLGR